MQETKSIEDNIIEAITLFKDEQYALALTLYNALIEKLKRIPSTDIKRVRVEKYRLNESPIVGPCIHPKLGSVLDQRAATYEKLGRLESALKDGQDLVRYEPLSCKGYLRVGKILSLLGKNVEAYRIYQRGLYVIEGAKKRYKVSVPEKLFQSLQSKYAQLNKELKAARAANNALSKRVDCEESQRQVYATSHLDVETISKNQKNKRQKRLVDPLENLPLEIISIIFRSLPFSSVLKGLMVSKLWYFTLISIPSLFDQLIVRAKVQAKDFDAGLNFLRKMITWNRGRQPKSLKIRSASNSINFSRLVELFLKDKRLKFRDLEIVSNDFSFELLLNKLNKLTWNSPGLRTIENLRFGINSSLRYENIILKIMPSLKSLDIVIIDKKMSSSNNDLLPRNDKLITLNQDEDDYYPSLETLSMLNHPHLLRSHNSFRVSSDSYNPYPIFLDKRFPNLVSLTVASFNFQGKEQLFGQFLESADNLKRLYMENCENMSLSVFFNILQSFEIKIQFEKLGIREAAIGKETHLNNVDDDALYQLHNLAYLDLYSSSLSVKGLSKLLSICNKNNRLKTLFIGKNNYIFFKNDKISLRVPKISLLDILKLAPHLEELYLNELDLDNSSMKFFNQDLHKSIGLENCKLRTLDLSFCNSIDGIGLMNLFGASLPKDQNYYSFLKIETLILDGIDINMGTLKSLVQRGHVRKLRCDPLRAKWKMYGINSLVPDV